MRGKTGEKALGEFWSWAGRGHTKAPGLTATSSCQFGVLSHLIVHTSEEGTQKITLILLCCAIIIVCNSLSTTIDTASEYITDLLLSYITCSHKGPHICLLKIPGLKGIPWCDTSFRVDCYYSLRDHPKMFLKHGHSCEPCVLSSPCRTARLGTSVHDNYKSTTQNQLTSWQDWRNKPEETHLFPSREQDVLCAKNEHLPY